MNKRSWSGIIIWGASVTLFGLRAVTSAAATAPDQEAIFLLAGGIVTLLIGVIGMIGFIRFIPGRNKQTSDAVGVRH